MPVNMENRALDHSGHTDNMTEAGEIMSQVEADIYVPDLMVETLNDTLEKIKTGNAEHQEDPQIYPLMKAEVTASVDNFDIRSEISRELASDSGVENSVPFQTTLPAQSVKTESADLLDVMHSLPDIKRQLSTGTSVKIESTEADDTRVLLAHYMMEMNSSVPNVSMPYLNVTNTIASHTLVMANSMGTETMTGKETISSCSQNQSDIVDSVEHTGSTSCSGDVVNNAGDINTHNSDNKNTTDSTEPNNTTDSTESNNTTDLTELNNTTNSTESGSSSMDPHSQVEVRGNKHDNNLQFFQRPEYQPVVRLEKLTNFSALSNYTDHNISTKSKGGEKTPTLTQSQVVNQHKMAPRVPKTGFKLHGNMKRSLTNYMDCELTDADAFTGDVSYFRGQRHEIQTSIKYKQHTISPLEWKEHDVDNSSKVFSICTRNDVCDREVHVKESRNRNKSLLGGVTSSENTPESTQGRRSNNAENQPERAVTGAKTYKCTTREYKCTKKRILTTHAIKHTGQEPCKFTVCHYRCSDKTGHTAEKPYKCTMCDYRSTIKTNLTRHVRTHTSEKPYKCSMCDYRCSQKCNLTIHVRTHTGEKPYKCTMCDYRCIVKSKLNIHVRTHTGEKPYKCSMCDYRCSVKSGLTKHVRTHTGEKPYKCTMCDYRCSVKSHLTKHVRTHTGERLYKCHVCNYKCITKTKLGIHFRTHTGEKPYKCTTCDYRCSDKRNLTAHVRTHSSVKPYKCTVCDYRCINKAQLTRHARIHSAEKPYNCTI